MNRDILQGQWHVLRGRIRSRYRLTFSLIDGLAILLFVLVYLRACLIDRDVLGFRQGLYCALTGRFLTSGVARHGNTHRGHRGVTQGRKICSAACAAD